MNNVRDIAESVSQNISLPNNSVKPVQNKSLADTVSSVSQEIEKSGEFKKDGKKLNEKEIKKLTNDLNDKMSQMNIQLQFIWHKEIQRMSVSMVDMNTMKTIRSFPPEELIKELVRAKEWVGRFLDKKA